MGVKNHDKLQSGASKLCWSVPKSMKLYKTSSKYLITMPS